LAQLRRCHCRSRTEAVPRSFAGRRVGAGGNRASPRTGQPPRPRGPRAGPLAAQRGSPDHLEPARLSGGPVRVSNLDESFHPPRAWPSDERLSTRQGRGPAAGSSTAEE
jgi:hypothetical protein